MSAGSSAPYSSDARSASSSRHHSPTIPNYVSASSSTPSPTASDLPSMHDVFFQYMQPQDAATCTYTTPKVPTSYSPLFRWVVSPSTIASQHASSYGRQHSSAAGGDGDRERSVSDAPSSSTGRGRGSSVGGGSRRGRKSSKGAGGAGDDDDDAPRRAPKKTENACMFCRGRKLKCDGNKPACANCERRKQPCEYGAIRRRGPGRKNKSKADEEMEEAGEMGEPGSSTGPGTGERAHTQQQQFRAYHPQQLQQQQQPPGQRTVMYAVPPSNVHPSIQHPGMATAYQLQAGGGALRGPGGGAPWPGQGGEHGAKRHATQSPEGKPQAKRPEEDYYEDDDDEDEDE